MNAEAEEFQSKRNPSEIAWVRVKDLANDDREGPLNEQFSMTVTMTHDNDDLMC